VSPIKVCGLTRTQDAIIAAKAGADLLGVVFSGRSPRAIEPAQAASLVASARRHAPQTQWIGVFVDAPAERIRHVADAVGLAGVQLHGDETSDTVDRLVRSGLFVIKALRIGDRADLARIDEYSPDAFLLDTYVPGLHGGTGRTFDWSIARDAAKTKRIILSGGLTADNVGVAVELARPWGVDASSGLEDAPGRKNVERLRAFIAAARRALTEREPE